MIYVFGSLIGYLPGWCGRIVDISLEASGKYLIFQKCPEYFIQVLDSFSGLVGLE